MKFTQEIYRHPISSMHWNQGHLFSRHTITAAARHSAIILWLLRLVLIETMFSLPSSLKNPHVYFGWFVFLRFLAMWRRWWSSFHSCCTSNLSASFLQVTNWFHVTAVEDRIDVSMWLVKNASIVPHRSSPDCCIQSVLLPSVLHFFPIPTRTYMGDRPGSVELCPWSWGGLQPKE